MHNFADGKTKSVLREILFKLIDILELESNIDND